MLPSRLFSCTSSSCVNSPFGGLPPSSMHRVGSFLGELFLLNPTSCVTLASCLTFPGLGLLICKLGVETPSLLCHSVKMAPVKGLVWDR